MRRESSTVVVLVGEVDEGLLAGLARLPNVSIARAPGDGAPADRSTSADAAATTTAGVGGHAASGLATSGSAARPGWQPGALALREAARRRTTYVIVPDDPLADVASRWRTMWSTSAGPAGADEFEERAADVLAAWRANRFDLPDYYLVLATDQPGGIGPDLYLGPLRAARPRRVAVVVTNDPLAGAPRVAEELRSLAPGPWWPPLDELLDTARRFYAGGLAETQG